MIEQGGVKGSKCLLIRHCNTNDVIVCCMYSCHGNQDMWSWLHSLKTCQVSLLLYKLGTCRSLAAFFSELYQTVRKLEGLGWDYSL